MMQLSDKYKIMLWTILSICVYYGGLYGTFVLALPDSVKNSIVTSQQFIPTVLYLIAFPFAQYLVSRKLKSSGNFQAASGIKTSIIIEIVPVILLLVFILKKMGA